MATQTITQSQRQRWIARTINAIAAANGIDSQRDLADRIGWTESKLSRKLHQDTRFSLEDIYEVADALGVDQGDLLNGWGGRVPVPEDSPFPGRISQAATHVTRELATNRSVTQQIDWELAA